MMIHFDLFDFGPLIVNLIIEVQTPSFLCKDTASHKGEQMCQGIGKSFRGFGLDKQNPEQYTKALSHIHQTIIWQLSPAYCQQAGQETARALNTLVLSFNDTTLNSPKLPLGV